MAKITLSVIKADVGSIGGHTKPSEEMLKVVRNKLDNAKLAENGAGAAPLIEDGLITHTGDDIAIIMSHRHGVGSPIVHKQIAMECFKRATEIAKAYGLYAAGQDILNDAPSGNVKGAGPGVAEIELETVPPPLAGEDESRRKAEAFLVFTADKCGPGAYNLPLWNTFCNPMENGGLMLSPKLSQGFTFTIIDMDHKDGDRVIRISTAEPHAHIKIGSLLRNIDRFAVEAIHSNAYPQEQIVSVTATRLHNIAKDKKTGKPIYTGKDDPAALIRVQGIFPAPEEVIAPYSICHFVTGDCRGSHTMALMPVGLNTAVRGKYCQPVVSCVAFSLTKTGFFTNEHVDMFGGVEWNKAREKALLKSEMIREQGFFGVAMASEAEIAYTGLVDMMEELDERFEVRK